MKKSQFCQTIHETHHEGEESHKEIEQANSKISQFLMKNKMSLKHLRAFHVVGNFKEDMMIKKEREESFDKIINGFSKSKDKENRKIIKKKGLCTERLNNHDNRPKILHSIHTERIKDSSPNNKTKLQRNILPQLKLKTLTSEAESFLLQKDDYQNFDRSESINRLSHKKNPLKNIKLQRIVNRGEGESTYSYI